MKQSLILLLCCCVFIAQAQHKTQKKKTHRRYGTGVVSAPPPPQIVTHVEQMAEFPGGQTRMLEYINTHLRYPDQAREAGIEGKVLVMFIIDQNGKVSDATVQRGIGGGCDQEALRVVRSMPQWKPAKKDGRAVKSVFVQPVMFRME